MKLTRDNTPAFCKGSFWPRKHQQKMKKNDEKIWSRRQAKSWSKANFRWESSRFEAEMKSGWGTFLYIFLYKYSKEYLYKKARPCVARVSMLSWVSFRSARKDHQDLAPGRTWNPGLGLEADLETETPVLGVRFGQTRRGRRRKKVQKGLH